VSKLARHRDLFGAPSRMGDAQIQGRMQFTTGTPTGSFSAAYRTLDQAAPQDFIDRWQLGDQLQASLQEAIHVLRPYSRKACKHPLPPYTSSLVSNCRDARNGLSDWHWG